MFQRNGYCHYYRNYGTYNGYISIENGNSKTVSPSSADGLLLRTLTITSKLSEVTDGDVLLAWLKVNATKQPAPAIDGYSEVVVNVEATDSPLPTEVSTEAEMTALLTSGEVGGVYKYTGTTGTYENGALYVLENGTITFTVAGTEFQAEEGMTWAEWCESDYNTHGAYINLGNGQNTVWWQSYSATKFYAVANADNIVGENDAIIADYSYTTQTVVHM